ncbi:hypothetical protein EI546_15070 [Aequorivita sp. H23M31]|uniref:Letm1 RBD domain-containing protein n=1 Tax=Aequorivita ciconiae TaxID=2494375 RepID=A0A410G6R5_9FLAO|nr:LETM1-related biofilm-associated protein [Aequorivita sp. H23M31]QAA82956.1 hypothetical protein EI546_15070 [Aequorivita sp. H23M31]
MYGYDLKRHLSNHKLSSIAVKIIILKDMNPSAPDWILKFLDLFDRKELVHRFENDNEFYDALKSAGFIYGISISSLPERNIKHLKLTKEELTKVNLFHALFYQYSKLNPKAEDLDAIKSILAFYREVEKGKIGFFHKFSLSHSPSHSLENILSARLQEGNALLKKNSLSLLTYALLFLDVMAYKHWLHDPKNIKEVYQHLEERVLNYCFYSLKSKQKKSKYDKLLIELYESSNEYVTSGNTVQDGTLSNRNTNLNKFSAIGKKYILDMCCLTIWEDFKLDETEHRYLLQIVDILELNKKEFERSLGELSDFSEKYTNKIVLFDYTSPVKQFYKQSASTVKLLIMRNKDRLVRELEESGELMVLLGQSTLRDLSVEEKSKVKDQLLDICKTIPSLTIFLLPGGSVLMPLLVKFIPKLLPSAFQDNRIDTKK